MISQNSECEPSSTQLTAKYQAQKSPIAEADMMSTTKANIRASTPRDSQGSALKYVPVGLVIHSHDIAFVYDAVLFGKILLSKGLLTPNKGERS